MEMMHGATVDAGSCPSQIRAHQALLPLMWRMRQLDLTPSFTQAMSGGGGVGPTCSGSKSATPTAADLNPHSVASRQVLRIRGGTACIPCIQSFAFFPFFFLLTKVIKFDTLRYMICILEDPEGSRPVELHAGVNLIRSFLWRKYWNISL